MLVDLPKPDCLKSDFARRSERGNYPAFVAARRVCPQNERSIDADCGNTVTRPTAQ
jgi:hypothetical protein